MGLGDSRWLSDCRLFQRKCQNVVKDQGALLGAVPEGPEVSGFGDLVVAVTRTERKTDSLCWPTVGALLGMGNCSFTKCKGVNS